MPATKPFFIGSRNSENDGRRLGGEGVIRETHELKNPPNPPGPFGYWHPPPNLNESSEGGYVNPKDSNPPCPSRPMK